MNNINAIPKQLFELSNLFNSYGFDLYLVGGSIRDFILGKMPSDFDFSTRAKTAEIIEIIKQYQFFRQGEKYGTIGVIFRGIKCEITTFRSDGLYSNNRHPDKVIFHDDLYTDLKRRDFTINALAYDLRNKILIDNFNCIKAIDSKIIKCIGNGDERFKEDSLRILRAFSFCSRLDFDISKSTLQSISNTKELLKNIKIERTRSELLKIFNGKNPKKALNLMKKYKVLDIGTIPKNINNINSEYRIYISFLIFNNFNYFHPTTNSKIILMQSIILQLTNNTNIKKIRYILANLITSYKIEDIYIAIHIKSSLNKQYRIYKNILNNIHKKQFVNGYDLLNLGIDKLKIKKIKKELLIYSIVNKVRDKRILLRKVGELNLS